MKSTTPPASGTRRTIERERLDHATMRALRELQTHRRTRLSGESAWDPLKKKLVHAATTLSIMGTDSTPLTDNLAAYCAFLASELEVNEALDLPADEEESRLRSFAPHALETLDVLTAPLHTKDAAADPVRRTLAKSFDAIRAELLAARGDKMWTISHDDWTVAA